MDFSLLFLHLGSIKHVEWYGVFADSILQLLSKMPTQDTRLFSAAGIERSISRNVKTSIVQLGWCQLKRLALVFDCGLLECDRVDSLTNLQVATLSRQIR